MNSIIKTKVKKCAKIFLVLSIVALVGLVATLLYCLHTTSKWTTFDEQRDAIALEDISWAGDIASELLDEWKEDQHTIKASKLLDVDDWFPGLFSCSFDHHARGFEILHNAATKGDKSAQFYLGLYYAGYWYLHDEDRKREAYWYQRAAEQGHVRAMRNLAWCYHDGIGVRKDYVKARKLMKSAAEKGNPAAQLWYGNFLKNENDIERAKQWWKKALKNKNASPETKKDAERNLEQIYD